MNNFKNLYLLKGYNNYFNRDIKGFDTINEYLDLVGSDNYSFQAKRNFNPADGVNASIILNNEEVYLDISDCDYCIITDDNNPETIESRWFILEADRTRSGQYELTLKRDVIYDFKESVLNAPCYIEKATISKDNPLIFNTEGMAFNQIKKDEILLKDEIGCPWILLYYAKNYPHRVDSSDTYDINIYFNDYDNEFTDAIDSTELPWSFTTSDVEIYNVDSVKLYAAAEVEHSISPLAITNEQLTQIYCDINLIPTTDALGNTFNLGSMSLSNNNIKYDKDETSDTIGSLTYITARPGVTHSYPLRKDELTFSAWKSNFTQLYQTNKSDFVEKIIDNLEDSYTIDYKINYENIELLYNNKIVAVTTGGGVQYYRLKIYKENLTNSSIVKFDVGSNINNLVKNFVTLNTEHMYSTIDFSNIESASVPSFGFTSNAVKYTIKAEQLEKKTFGNSCVLSDTHPARRFTEDSCFDVLAIPYGDIWYNGPLGESSSAVDPGTKYRVVTYDTQEFKTDKRVGLLFAQDIAARTSGGEGIGLYDMQIVPYCPIRNYMKKAGDGSYYIYVDPLEIDDEDFKNNTVEVMGIYDTTTLEPKSFAFKCKSVNGTFNIPLELSVPKVTGIENIDLKIANECDNYRLCSPNYASAFEFSVAKNGGVDYFNVDYNYRPYTPYIHVNPNFKNLYGQDWNDATGLILGGDLSLAHTSSAWVNYQANNATYRQSFNRQLENLDVNNKIAMEQQIFSGVSGIVSDTFKGLGSGAATGMLAGGPIGGLIGGAVGATTAGTFSAIGAAKDMDWLKRQQTEAKSYATDMYNYSLRNIQAIPYTLNGVNCNTENFKYFPFIEYYTATDIEKSTFTNKLKYNGMTVMAIGTLQEYIKETPSYIKGQIIKLPELQNDTHLANAIFTEILRGVYI